MKQEIQTTINGLRQLGNCPVYLELVETDPEGKGGLPITFLSRQTTTVPVGSFYREGSDFIIDHGKSESAFHS